MTDPVMCERCGAREASPQQCPGDRAHHHHGMVHVLRGGLEAVCSECVEAVRVEWGSRRPAGDPSDPRGDA